MPFPDGLPAPGERRHAVRLTPDALRQVRGGHPWIYAESITSISHDGASGDLAVVFDADRRFAAIGLYDPDSPIRIRVLHQGHPATIDTEHWRRRLRAAMEKRRGLIDVEPATTGMRLVNGENDGFPGLVLDRYAETLVIKLYAGIWWAHLTAIVPVVVDELRPRAVVLRLSRQLQSAGPPAGLADGSTLHGEPPAAPTVFREHGLQFEADVVHGQKTGHFLDQRDNRVLAGSMCGGARVLDVFASTGGFTVHAAAGGATKVTSVDASAPTLAVAARNLDLNRDVAAVRRCEHRAIVGDAFAVMDGLLRERATFDVVIVDPPSFAQREHAVPRALHAYGQLAERSLRLLDHRGVLVQASCSTRVGVDELAAAISAAAARVGRPVRELRRTGHPVDHPVTFPQGAYLKAIFARAET